MSAFDFATATPAEVRAEAARRAALRSAGQSFSLSEPHHAVHEKPRGAPSWGVDSARALEVRLSGEVAAMEWNGGVRRIRLPWSVLCPDNEKYGATTRKGRPLIVLSGRYRLAKRRAKEIAARQVFRIPLLQGPVRVTGRLFEPDRRWRRDVSNLMKLAHDVLIGLCYEDDAQIDDVHWTRAGVDIDHPRLELVVEALP